MVLVMDNCFFIGSLCVVGVMSLYGSFFISIISIIIIIYVFSDRVKSIERKVVEADENKKRKRKAGRDRSSEKGSGT